MKHTHVESRSQWDEALGRAGGHTSFLQSYEWGEFQRSVGHEPIRTILPSGTPVQCFRHRIGGLLEYVYAPRLQIREDEIEALVGYVRLKTKAFFLRIEPLEPLMPIGAIGTRSRQPQHTLVLDITPTSEAISGQMHAKTRYNIHLAERKGVSVVREKDVDVFKVLNRETTARDHFRSHQMMYYQRMLECPLTLQFTAYLGRKPLASIICIGYGKIYTYLHGASSNQGRNVMPMYLLQWRAIELAKTQGFIRYDLWGVAPPVPLGDPLSISHHRYTWNREHSFSGITRFKAGFGGEHEMYPGAIEIPVRPTLYRWFRIARRIIR